MKGASSSRLLNLTQSKSLKNEWFLIFSAPFGPEPRRFYGSRSSNLTIKSRASSDIPSLITTGLSVIIEKSSLQFFE